MQIAPVERKKDWVLNELLERFATGHFHFGQKISAKALVEETGISRFPIMAALNDLRIAGFVKVTAQVGCQVISPSSGELRDFFFFFSRMEGMLAELAAERRDCGEVRAMRLVNDRIKKIAPSPEAGEEYRRLNRDLHRSIHNAARSPALHVRQLSNWAMADFLISQAGAFVKRFRQAAKEHDGIITAIERGATVRARQSMEAHILTFGETVVALSEDMSATDKHRATQRTG